MPRLREQLGTDLDDAAVFNHRRFNAEQGETVLVVDDEAAIRMLVSETLQELGYKAIEAAQSTAAIGIGAPAKYLTPAKVKKLL